VKTQHNAKPAGGTKHNNPNTKSMMHLLILAFSLLISLSPIAKANYRPTIVILDPYQKDYDTTLLKDIKKFDSQTYPTPEDEQAYFNELKNKEKNIQIMDSAEWVYRKKIDFAAYFTLSLDGMLTYAVWGKTNKGLIFPTHNKSGIQAKDLQAIANKYNVTWVINPVTIHTYLKDNSKFTTVRLQVYNAKKKKVVLDQEYTGGTTDPGFELSCDEGTLECTINNILNSSVNDIMLTIFKRYQH